MNKQAKQKAVSVGKSIYCALIYLFLFCPITVVVANSFNATTTKPYLSWKGFTLDWYVKLFDGSNSSILEAFGHTMTIAVASTILAVMLGTLAAVGMYKYQFKGKNIIDGLLYIPVVIPEIILGIALLTLFSNVSLTRGMVTLILAHATFSVPFVVFNIRARLHGYDGSIEEASMDLGANRIVTFLRITLPVLAPGISGGAILAFTLSIDDVIISYFVNGTTSTFPLKVMESVKMGVSPAINALSTLVLVATIFFVVLTQTDLLKKTVKKIKKKCRN
ncbi:MAG: ABC transporter permease [Eubacteriales bacterium]